MSDLAAGTVAGAAGGVGAPGGAVPVGARRRHRRVVALSPQDSERVVRGELPEAAAEVERRRSVDALTEARGRADSAADHANDARLLRDVPPHWGG